MDVITTDVVKEEQVHGNSSNNLNLGELSNPASNLIPDVATPSLTLDSLSSVVEEPKVPTEEESTESVKFSFLKSAYADNLQRYKYCLC